MIRLQRFREFNEEESGAALTEFAITLPIFMFLLSAIMTLGHLGQAAVATKPEAYRQMWMATNEASLGNAPRHISPRGQFVNTYEAVSNVPNVGALDPVTVISAATDAATGAGGHWWESMLYTDLGFILSGSQVHYSQGGSDAANRLQNHFQTASYSDLTSSVIGSDTHRPKYVLDDNLIDESSNLVQNFQGASGPGDIITGLVAGLIEAAAVFPGAFAGIRYGDVEGQATSSAAKWGGRDFGFTRGDPLVFQAQYSTSISPRALDDQSIPFVDWQLGSIGREQGQYMLYMMLGQLNTNQRQALDVLGQDYSSGASFSVPGQYGGD